MKTITYNPETHVLVPREPSEEMIRSAAFHYSSDEYTGFISTYKAALSAAPQPEPEQQSVKPVAVVAAEMFMHCIWTSTEAADWAQENVGANLYSAPPELAAIKTELREICAAIDDPACDLVLTTVECIKRLKAENESLKRDAERWRTMSALMFLGNVECTQDADGGYRIELDPAENMLGVSWEGNSPEEAIDDAMAKGDKP